MRGKRSAESLLDAKAEFLMSEDDLRESLREWKEESARDGKLNWILGVTLAATLILSVAIITSVALCVSLERVRSTPIS